MIVYEKKPNPQPALEEAEENRFERIRKATAERRRKADTRGASQTAEDRRIAAGRID